jgi:hypothetical protein
MGIAQKRRVAAGPEDFSPLPRGKIPAQPFEQFTARSIISAGRGEALLKRKLQPAGLSDILLFHNSRDNYRKAIGILGIGLCPKVIVRERPKVIVLCAPK